MISSFIRCVGLATVVAAAVAAPPGDRTVEAILEELDADSPGLVPAPGNDPEAADAFIKALREEAERRDRLTLELFQADPGNSRLPKLFAERWGAIRPVGKAGVEMEKEIDEVAMRAKGVKLRVEAAYFKASILLYRDTVEANRVLAAVDEFSKMDPKDDRPAELLYALIDLIEDKAKRSEVEEKLLGEYPHSDSAGRLERALRHREAIGKPFELAFTDAISGKAISISGLKSRVVVIDFWATWCGPCVGEMPTLKRLYSEYKDQGVEFIGVSLDHAEGEGGLEALRRFVASNQIPWPQYYQGKGWESEFSSKWGITGIPSAFVVDTKGNLASVDARGKLELLIPKLLKADATVRGE